jgi:hypothetical protein
MRPRFAVLNELSNVTSYEEQQFNMIVVGLTSLFHKLQSYNKLIWGRELRETIKTNL